MPLALRAELQPSVKHAPTNPRPGIPTHQPRTNRLGPRAAPRQWLNKYPTIEGVRYSHFSFLGIKDTGGGKYFVPKERQLSFLDDYLTSYSTHPHGLYLAESTRGTPYRFFQEVDLDLEVDAAEAVELLHVLIPLIAATAADFFKLDAPLKYILSARDARKIHLNFPEVITTEFWVREYRGAMMNECAAQLGDRMDWGKVIDEPHGSLRMLGSRKAYWMDKDPEWLTQKAYLPAQLDGKTLRIRNVLNMGLLTQTSILPTSQQLARFLEVCPKWKEDNSRFKGMRKTGDMSYLDNVRAVLQSN